jgi:tetratricopeptide (TPR) repeat protein
MPFLALIPALLLPAAAGARVSVDSLEAKGQVRVCLSLSVEKDVAIQGCREALALGLAPDWAAAIRLYLARRLADAMRWDEVIEVYRTLAESRPRDAEARLRLGNALLFGVGRGAEAEGAYRQALELAPEEAAAWGGLGAALNAQARHSEAATAFERALAVDPGYFDSHEASRVVYEASRRNEVWPPVGAPPSP